MSVILHKEKRSEVHYFTDSGEHPFTAMRRTLVSFDAPSVMYYFENLVGPYYPEITRVEVREFNPTTGQTYGTFTYDV